MVKQHLDFVSVAMGNMVTIDYFLLICSYGIRVMIHDVPHIYQSSLTITWLYLFIQHISHLRVQFFSLCFILCNHVMHHCLSIQVCFCACTGGHDLILSSVQSPQLCAQVRAFVQMSSALRLFSYVPCSQYLLTYMFMCACKILWTYSERSVK